MFRKTPSDKPDTTVFKELRNEFSNFFDAGERKTASFLNRYPRQIFMGMVSLIILSSLLTFLLPIGPLNTPKEQLKESNNPISISSSGEINLLMDLGGRAKRIYELKKEMERILLKDSISKEDSIFLEQAIVELEYFNNPKHKADEN